MKIETNRHSYHGNNVIPKLLIPTISQRILEFTVFPSQLKISPPSRRKRVAGAVVVDIIAGIIALVSAITSAVALTGTLQNAATINDLQNTTTTALRTQQCINPHIGTGLAILQQQMDLLHEEVEGLWLHTRLDCDPRFQQLCLTPFPVKNHSEEVRRLSSLLRGSWNRTFLNATNRLSLDIEVLSGVHANPIRLDFDFLTEIWENLKKMFSPSWIVIWLIAIAVMIGLCILGYCMYRYWMCSQFKYERLAMAVQASLDDDTTRVAIYLAQARRA
ncbi:uncharacterized protein LOC104870526 [Fukomys damarensis]|uniref:uncharacterized protein LOC104870526 n=1 Tax=Fukomys damarensis TaxID=885580 RepID=UPI00053FFD14|nr:uncharacterized protein LOC104870526 [Fukomys damarensis]